MEWRGALEKSLQHLRIKESSLSSVMIFFFNEETSSHFPPEGFETKAKVQLTFFKTFFLKPQTMSVYALLPLQLFSHLKFGVGRAGGYFIFRPF